jgi:hypothetical protein
VVEASDVVIVSKKTELFKKEMAHVNHGTFVIDLVRLNNNVDQRTPYYGGLCW